MSHIGEAIFELVNKATRDVGSNNVVRVVTDNASKNMGEEALLHAERPNIFWISCATHIAKCEDKEVKGCNNNVENSFVEMYSTFHEDL